MTLYDLKKLLKQKQRDLPALLFFCGEDTVSLEEALTLVVDTLLEPSERDFNLHDFSGEENDMEGLFDALRTFPVFAARRVVILRRVEDLSAESQTALAAYLKEPVAEAVLLMTAHAPDNRKSLFKTLKECALTVDFPKLRGDRLAATIREKAQERGVRFDSEALDLFCQLCGGETWKIELEKLLAFLGNRTQVSVEDVGKATSDNREVSQFDTLDAIGRGDARALVMVHRVLEDGSPSTPMQFLGLLARHFRQLWICRTLLEQKRSDVVITAEAKIPGFCLGKMKSQALRFSSSGYRRIFEWLLETDKGLKSSADKYALLEMLTAKILALGASPSKKVKQA